MKKIYSYTFLLIFTISSMFITNQIINSYHKSDPIMKEIKKYSLKNNIDSMDASIIDQELMSGAFGKSVDIEKSYSKMKQYGSYNELLMVFYDQKPDVSIEDYYDKYLIKGNGLRREVSLVFIVSSEKDYSSLFSLLKKKNISVSFFVDGSFLENKKFITPFLDYEVELLNYREDYEAILFKTSLDYLSHLSNKTPSFCFTEGDNIEILSLCSSLKLHTIKGDILPKNNMISTVKSKLENSIFFPIKDYSISELSSLIDYIHQKGYSFVSIRDLFQELSS